MSDGTIDRMKLAKLDGLVQDLLDEIEDAGAGDVAAEALFEPLSQASAALHSVLTRYATLTKPATPGWQGIEADEARIAAWVTDRFGADSLDNAMERADRLLEEAIEMQQAIYAAAGCYPEVAIRRANDLVQHVNAKPAGDPRQEMGGVMTCALALGRRLGVRLDLAAQAELTRIEGLSKAHFDKRHQAKVDAGVAAQHERP